MSWYLDAGIIGLVSAARGVVALMSGASPEALAEVSGSGALFVVGAYLLHRLTSEMDKRHRETLDAIKNLEEKIQ